MAFDNKSAQERYGERTLKRIRKAAKPDIADFGIGILQSIQKGLQQRVKSNLERIDTNFEDEEIRLTNLYNDYNDSQKIIDTLTAKGNGDLVTGIMYDKVGKIKDAAAVANFEGRIKAADTNDNLFIRLKKEAEDEANILLKRNKELSTLRTSYDPEQPDEGILLTDLKTEAQFKQPIRNAIKTLTLNQKDKGNNNVLDVIMSGAGLSTRGNYDMIEDFFQKEIDIDKIIKSSIAARDALPIYQGDSVLLANYIQEKEKEGADPQGKKGDSVKQNFTNLVAAMRQFVSQDLKLKGDGSFYFMPSRDKEALKLKDSTSEELSKFTEKFGYTQEDIYKYYYQAQAYGESVFDTNSNILVRLKESSPTMLLSKDNFKSIAAAEAQELLAKHNYNINSVPEEKRGTVASLLDISFPGLPKIDDDEYIQQAPLISSKAESNFNKNTLTLFNRLPDEKEMIFNYTVLNHAKKLMNAGIEESRAIDIASNVQKLGIVTKKQFTELLGLVTERDIKSKLPQEDFLAQPFVAFDSEAGRVVQPLLDLYGTEFNFSPERFVDIENQLNKQPLYFYEPETITTKNPKMFTKDQQYSIAQAIYQFSPEPDEEGRRWIRVK